jgi:hypothetical protein
VEDVGDAETGLVAAALHLGEDFGEPGAGNYAVLHDVVGRNAAHCGEGGFAALPDERSLLLGLGEALFPRAVALADGSDLDHLGGDFGGWAVEFDQQQGFTVRIACVDRGFAGGDGDSVHHLHGAGQHAGGDYVADGLRGCRGLVEGGEERLHGFGAANDAQDCACGDAQSAFRADEDSGEIVTGRVDYAVFGAEPCDFARWQNDFAAEDVRDGEAVLQAVRSTGVFGEVAADGADALRRWIRSVEEACGFDSLCDLRVRYSGFDGDAGVVEVDCEDAVHARERDDDAAFLRERSSAEARSGAAGDEGDFVFCADADGGLDFGGGAGEDYCPGEGSEVGEAVALVGLELVGLLDEATVANGGAEFGEDDLSEHGVLW